MSCQTPECEIDRVLSWPESNSWRGSEALKLTLCTGHSAERDAGVAEADERRRSVSRLEARMRLHAAAEQAVGEENVIDLRKRRRRNATPTPTSG